MNDTEPTGKICPILDPETRRQRQADMDARFGKIVEIGTLRFGVGQSDRGRERDKMMMSDRARRVEVRPDAVTLEEARQQVTFAFGLPTWLPDGFTTDGKIYVDSLPKQFGTRPPNHIWMSWSHPTKHYLTLRIRYFDPSPNVIHGPRSAEEGGLFEVQVNGLPAAFVTRHRMFRLSTGESSWLNTGESTLKDFPLLVWVIGDVHYELSCAKDVLTLEELIRIAESVQHAPNLNTP